MAATDFIVAIELGSSKITGIAGKKNSDGSIQVLACTKENSSAFIRKGVIYNLDKTAQSLTSIINQLEATLNGEIAMVYVGIGGQSMRTITNTVSRFLPEETILSQELIDDIRDENIQIPLIDLDILDIAPQEYKIGNNLQADPVGVLSDNIEGHFLNIIANSKIQRNVLKCFKQANIKVADIIITPLATAHVVLTDNEKRSGCALVDFGADTTTVSVYKNNILRHLTVLPLGGNNITKDICSLQLEEGEAEIIKIKYGNAINDIVEEEAEKIEIKLGNDTVSIEAKVLNGIIEARTEEIIANVWNQIELSGYAKELLAGIILTGGASALKGLDQLLRITSKIEKIRTANSVHIGLKFNKPDMLSKDGSQNTIIGLLEMGNENCCKTVEVKVEITPPKNLFAEEEVKIDTPKTPVKEVKAKKPDEPKKPKGENRLSKWLKNKTDDLFSDNEL